MIRFAIRVRLSLRFVEEAATSKGRSREEKKGFAEKRRGNCSSFHIVGNENVY